MRLVWRLLVAASLLLTWATSPMADPRLEKWAALPSDQSGIVLIIDASVSSVSIFDSGKDLLASTKWSPQAPFVRQFRMEPGLYTINLQGPVPHLSVELVPGKLTYVRLGPYRGTDNDVGVYAYVTSGGHPEFDQIAAALETAEQRGHIPDVFRTDFIRPRGNLLLVNTEPPWPIPPPPPKR